MTKENLRNREDICVYEIKISVGAVCRSRQLEQISGSCLIELGNAKVACSFHFDDIGEITEKDNSSSTDAVNIARGTEQVELPNDNTPIQVITKIPNESGIEEVVSPAKSNDMVTVTRRKRDFSDIQEVLPPPVIELTNTTTDLSRVGKSSGQGLSAEEVHKKLDHVAKESHKLRATITRFSIVTGVIPFVLTMVISWLLTFSVLDQKVFGYPGYYTGLSPWFICLSMFGVLPNDTFQIRLLTTIWLGICILQSLLNFLGFLSTLSKEREMWIENPDGTKRYWCTDEESMVGCVVLASRGLVLSLSIGVIGFYLFRNLARHDGEQVFDWKKEKGFRFNDQAFKVPARISLESLWLYLRLGVGSIGLVFTVYSPIFTAIDLGSPYVAADVFGGINFLLASATFSNHRRRSIMSWLQSFHSQGEAQMASTVAALLGGHNAKASIKKANELFRSISFAVLKVEDFASNQESEEKKNELHSRTKCASLGSCDAFISHSWRDNGEQKFQVLTNWCTEFKNKTGRDAELWLDKACIDQSSIESSLLCLPIFLSGCTTLLIIMGPTYSQRLWCVIEVFTFLKMGGDVKRITILPIQMTDNEARELFSKIDVSTAECFLEEEQQRLLAVVEQGFTNFDDFNSIVRQVFKERAFSSFNFSAYRSHSVSRKVSVSKSLEILSNRSASSLSSLSKNVSFKKFLAADSYKQNSQKSTRSSHKVEPAQPPSAAQQ